MSDPARIKGYHAHVYYDDDSQETAAHLRDGLDARFTVTLGRWHDKPVGPHPQSMYQVAFDTDQFAAVVPWLMMNRNDLAILVHPRTDDDVADHFDHALWLGRPLALNRAFLEEFVAAEAARS